MTKPDEGKFSEQMQRDAIELAFAARWFVKVWGTDQRNSAWREDIGNLRRYSDAIISQLRTGGGT